MAPFAPRAWLIASSLAIAAGAFLSAGDARAAVKAASTPAPIIAPEAERAARESAVAQTAIFGNGPFGAAEAVFSQVAGVSSVAVGQAGPPGRFDPLARFRGARPPGDPRPVEAVRVVYDPATIRFDHLLRIYFTAVIDPTQPGGEFRSLLVPTSQEQLLVATAYLSQMRASGLWPQAIVTRIEPTRRFSPLKTQEDAPDRSADAVRTIASKQAVLRRHFPQFHKGAFTAR